MKKFFYILLLLGLFTTPSMASGILTVTASGKNDIPVSNYHVLTSYDIIAGGGPSTGYFEIYSNVTGADLLYYYEIRIDNFVVDYGVFDMSYPVSYGFEASAGTKVELYVRHDFSPNGIGTGSLTLSP